METKVNKMKSQKIECELCGKKIISYGYVVSGYIFCSKDCLRKFRLKRFKQ